MTESKRPLDSKKIGDVEIHTFAVDWNDLGWCTLQNLGLPLISPGRDEVIMQVEKVYLHALAPTTTLYANPGFVVTALGQSANSTFLRAARGAQRSFWHQARTVLGKSWRTAMAGFKGLHRQFAFNGVLIVQGRHIHPQTWPDNCGSSRI